MGIIFRFSPNTHDIYRSKRFRINALHESAGVQWMNVAGGNEFVIPQLKAL
jgi:hypothetical protein